MTVLMHFCVCTQDVCTSIFSGALFMSFFFFLFFFLFFQNGLFHSRKPDVFRPMASRLFHIVMYSFVNNNNNNNNNCERRVIFFVFRVP